MRVDHVIYGTADLDAATARIEADLGLTAVAGGRHDGQGTHNRIVALADGRIVTVGRDGRTGRLTGAAEALAEPYLPFFIERPGASAAPARPAIEWIELAGDGARVADWVGGGRLPIRVVAGEPRVRALAVGGRELRTR